MERVQAWGPQRPCSPCQRQWRGQTFSPWWYRLKHINIDNSYLLYKYTNIQLKICQYCCSIFAPDIGEEHVADDKVHFSPSSLNIKQSWRIFSEEGKIKSNYSIGRPEPPSLTKSHLPQCDPIYLEILMQR